MKRRIFYTFVVYTAIVAAFFMGITLRYDTEPTMLVIAAIAGAAVFLMIISRIAYRLAHDFSHSVNEIDLQAPLRNDVWDEFTPLVRKLYAHHLAFERQEQELARRKVEFDALATGMNEGLTILDEHCVILACNQAAIRLLHADKMDYVGVDLLHLTRDTKLRDAAIAATNGVKSDYLVTRGNEHLQYFVSPVEGTQRMARGVVILILDVSARYQAERSRREFTANVSHELKTPLTSVLGYAEMLKMGLVQTADMPQFAERIHQEAGLLLALVDDIIKLSRLDERCGDMPFETINLYDTAHMAIDRLTAKAQSNHITLSVEGDPCTVQGMPPLVLDLITNLCDNAIKYNRPAGTVTVTTSKLFGGTRVMVTDTGYGIPIADQPHIFERFYRADKSRLRGQAVTGTGLGLSIVKHICELHNATISVRSSEQGTCFTVDFLS